MNFNPGGGELPSLGNVDKVSQGTTIKPKSAATSKRRVIAAVANEQAVSSPREQVPHL